MGPELADQLRALLIKASAKTRREQFGQEPNYTAALFGNLNGETFFDSCGSYLTLTCSPSDDRGRNSAESRTGIDIGIVVQWVDPNNNEIFEKAVLLQAKNNLECLTSSEQSRLQKQCEKMKRITESYVVMDCPYDGSVPKIGRSDDIPPYWRKPLVGLDDYLIDTVFQCLDGDTRSQVITQAKYADRRVVIATNSPKPGLKRKARKGM